MIQSGIVDALVVVDFVKRITRIELTVKYKRGGQLGFRIRLGVTRIRLSSNNRIRPPRKTGSGSDPRNKTQDPNLNPNEYIDFSLFSFDIKVDNIDFLILYYHFGQ